MGLDKIENYKMYEDSVLNETDKKHISNYQQLIKFFENALENSIKDDKIDYRSLHMSCIQSIRYLDSLIHSYESAVRGVRAVNSTIDKILSENLPKEELGNEEVNQEK